MARSLLSIVAVVALAAASPIAIGASPEVELARLDVVITPAAIVSPADRKTLTMAAQSLRSDGKPTKFLIRRDRPAAGPELAETLRNRLSAANGFTGTVIVHWQRPRSGAGIAGPFTPDVGQAAFERLRPKLRENPLRGVIALAQALPSGDADPGLTEEEPPLSDDSVGFTSPADDDTGINLAIFVTLGMILIGFLIRLGRRLQGSASTAPERPDVGTQKAMMEPLLDALASQINAIRTDVEVASGTAAAARHDYDEAVLAYGAAQDALPLAGTPAAVDAIGERLEAGLIAIRRARSVLDGRPVPPDSEPLLAGLCRFDPKHGMAVEDVVVSGARGGSLRVPACAACAQSIADKQTPTVRTVTVDGSDLPYWAIPRPSTGWPRHWRHPTWWLVPASTGAAFGFLDDRTLAPAADDGRGGWSSTWGGLGGGASGGDFGSSHGDRFGGSSGGGIGGSSGGDFGGASGGDMGGSSDASSGSPGGASGGDF